MARSRNIKPAFFSNDDLAELPALTRLYFIGLWTIADFKGCLEYRPKRIKAQILPYDDCDIETMTIALMRSDLISIYSVDGENYIKVTNFTAHQNPHKQEVLKGSDIPDLPEDFDFKQENKNGLKTEQNPNEIGCHPADSLNLIPDSLNPLTDTRKSGESGKHMSADASIALINSCFDDFWDSGIRKVNKKKTKPLFAKTVKKHTKLGGHTADEFTRMLVIDIKKRLDAGQLGFAEMHPTTYLNNERWNDEIRSGGNYGQPKYRESLAERSARETAEILADIKAREAHSSPVGAKRETAEIFADIEARKAHSGPMGANDPTVRTQMAERTGAGQDGDRGLLDGIFTVVQEDREVDG